MRLRISGPSLNVVIPVPPGVSFAEDRQELTLEIDGAPYTFRGMRLRRVEPRRLSFSALAPLGSGSGQAPEEVTLDFF